MRTCIAWGLFVICLIGGVFEFIDTDLVRVTAMMLGCVIALPQTTKLFAKGGGYNTFFATRVVIVTLVILATSIRVVV